MSVNDRKRGDSDAIGWRLFMEGMVSKEAIPIQSSFVTLTGSPRQAHTWIKGLVVKLLEVTHGQWLYRNVHVHDNVSGLHATQRKEELQQAIK